MGDNAVGGKPRRLPAAQRSEQLLDGAEEQFKAKGYDRTSIEDIARTAGVSGSIVHQHHGSKEGVDFACMARATCSPRGVCDRAAAAMTSDVVWPRCIRYGRRHTGVILGALLAASGCSSAGGGTARPPTSRLPSPVSPTTVHRAPMVPLTVAAAPSARVTQPAQPTSGPGSSDVPFHDLRVSSGGIGADAWYVFEPITPKPRSAPLAVVMHGYYEFSGYDSMYELIRHTVLSGSIVIYPRWQTAVATPCPGPFNIEPCHASATNGIRGALRFLRADKRRVQPEIDRTSYFGFSFGGIVTADLANRWQHFGLPEPRAIFLDDPHDGGLTAAIEPAVDRSLAGIPSSVLLVCHVGAQGVIADPTMHNGSCNAIFPKLVSVPAAGKNLVLTEPDGHGTPGLSSKHGVCAGGRGQANAYDWNFCWRVWDALRSAAYNQSADRRFALGNTPQLRNNGVWSDGTPIVPLKVQDAAPIRP